MDKKTLKWIYEKVKFCKKQLVFLASSSVFLSVFSVVLAFFTKGIIDYGVKENLGGIIITFVILLLLLAVNFVVDAVFQYLQEKTRNKIEFRIKSSLFSNIIKKDYEQVVSYNNGDLMTRFFSDVSVVTDGVLRILPALASTVAGLITVFVVLTYIDYKFSIIFCVLGLIMFFASRILKNKIKNLHLDMQQEHGKLRSFVQEIVSNLLAVITNDTDNNTLKKAETLQNNFFKARLRKRKLAIFSGIGVNLAFDLGYAYALLWGAVNIAGKIITYGTFAAVLQLVIKFQEPFAGLSLIFPQIYSTLASAERIIEVENLSDFDDIEVSVKEYNSLTSIEFDNVTFSYDEETVIENATFSVPLGKFTTFSGPSGIGKSTIFKLLLGAYKNFDGEILIKGPERQIKISDKTRALFSYVPQGNMLFSGSIKENLCFMTGNYNEQDVKNALSISCCDDFISLLPEKENTVIGEHGIGLSDGQVQRLAIARALLKKAPIILLDEATSALDKDTEQMVLNNLKNMKDVTVVSISHKTASAKISDICYQILNKKIFLANPAD